MNASPAIDPDTWKHASARFGSPAARSGGVRRGRMVRCRRSRVPAVMTWGRDRVGCSVFLNNRYYDPATGVFVSVDPLVGRTGTPYLYANGNPSTFSDPNGLCAHNNGRQGYDDGKGDCVRKGYPGGSTSACWGAAETPQYCVSTPGTKADFADGLMRRWDENWNKTESERAEYFLTLMGGDPGNLDFAFEMARNRNLADYWMHHPDEALSMGTWRPAMAAMWAAGALYIAEGAGNQGSSSSSACHSFDPRTEVVMADGTRKHIAEVKVGDYVLTTDPVTSVLMMRRVTELHINHDTDLADVVVADAKGQQATLHTTQRHMFWDDTRGAWTEAGELRPGDRLHDLVGGLVTVVGVHDLVGARAMYDLTVEGVHTYYVEAGAGAVLVHNCDLDALSKSGRGVDPSDAGGQLTRAGRAYAKAGEVFGSTSGGPAVINAAGQSALDEILTNSGTISNVMSGGNFAGGLVFISPNGVAAVFGADGVFQYFGRMPYP